MTPRAKKGRPQGAAIAGKRLKEISTFPTGKSMKTFRIECTEFNHKPAVVRGRDFSAAAFRAARLFGGSLTIQDDRTGDCRGWIEATKHDFRFRLTPIDTKGGDL